MTKRELINRLEDFDDDSVVIIWYDGGWSNIETVETYGASIKITVEEYPVFSDN